jgi:hypothetical protein
VQIPRTFQHGATHAERDGRVDSIKPAAAGGHIVSIDGEEHYVPTELAPLHQQGDRVEAGDLLSEGMANPQKIVEHKGIGEGRRYLAEQLHNIYSDAGIKHHRVNLELLARGCRIHCAGPMQPPGTEKLGRGIGTLNSLCSGGPHGPGRGLRLAG